MKRNVPLSSSPLKNSEEKMKRNVRENGMMKLTK